MYIRNVSKHSVHLDFTPLYLNMVQFFKLKSRVTDDRILITFFSEINVRKGGGRRVQFIARYLLTKFPLQLYRIKWKSSGDEKIEKKIYFNSLSSKIYSLPCLSEEEKEEEECLLLEEEEDKADEEDDEMVGRSDVSSLR